MRNTQRRTGSAVAAAAALSTGTAAPANAGVAAIVLLGTAGILKAIRIAFALSIKLIRLISGEIGAGTKKREMLAHAIMMNRDSPAAERTRLHRPARRYHPNPHYRRCQLRCTLEPS